MLVKVGAVRNCPISQPGPSPNTLTGRILTMTSPGGRTMWATSVQPPARPVGNVPARRSHSRRRLPCDAQGEVRANAQGQSGSGRARRRGIVSRRSWVAVEGSLEPISYDGLSFFRFPEAVAEHVIERYSAPGDWVMDPFCGFGTTLVVAERLGRHAVGYEVNERRAAFSAARVGNPDRVVHGSCEDLTPAQWPPFALLFTSPPYWSFRSDGNGDLATYLADARRLFSGFARLLRPGATVAVEVSQLRQGNRTLPLAWQLGAVLHEIFPLREDLVRVNTGDTQAGPGYDHDHVLVFNVPLAMP